MTFANLIDLLPFILLGAGAVVVLLAIAIQRNHRVSIVLTLVALALAFVSLFASDATVQVTPLLIVDGYARFFIGLIVAASFAVAILSYGYLEQRATNADEFYILLLLATLGSAVLISSSHFASFFLGLEILSISLYTLIAYLRTSERGVEAGIKYLILAAASAAFLLFGMALVYAETGTMELARLAALPAITNSAQNLVLLTGFAMMIVGIGFKLAVVPFHLWTPDVYEGAPAPTTAFVATVSKGAMFALLLRYFTFINVQTYHSLYLAFVLIALASMIGGNVLALLQTNVKRILAYSSIAHLGYLLVAFLASGPLAATAVAFYLVSYFITTLGAFGVVTVLSGDQRDADEMDDYRALFYRRPWLAGVLTAMLFSLAGIPLTSGFIGKFYLVMAGASTAQWLLVIVLVLTSALGLFYYLRIIVALYSAPAEPMPTAARQLSLAGGIVLAVLTLLLVWLGVYPAPIIQLIQAMVGRLI